MPRFPRTVVSASLAVALAAAAIAAPGTSEAKSCVKWQAAMARGRISLMPSGKSILVKPFADFTKREGDGWLATGLMNFAGDLISSAKDARVLSGITAAHGKGPYDYTVDGIYQHLDSNMRIFIKLSDSGGQLIAQREVLFPYPDNAEFFSKTATAVEELMGVMKLSHDRSLLAPVRDATASTRAYESYSKGRDALEAYTPAKAEAAIELFIEAKRLDYASPLGYQGIAAANDFLGLYNKLSGRPFDTFFQRAERELGLAAKLTKQMSPVFGYIKPKATAKDAGILRLADRFLLGNASYREGSAAAARGDHAAAAAAFRKAAELVPEDAMAWQRLANSESMLGNAEASAKAQDEAGAIDPCIGNP